MTRGLRSKLNIYEDSKGELTMKTLITNETVRVTNPYNPWLEAGAKVTVVKLGIDDEGEFYWCKDKNGNVYPFELDEIEPIM